MGRKPLSTKQFIQARRDLYGVLKRTTQQVEVINQNYIKEHCTVRVGETIDIPEGSKEGYSRFTISKITPDVQEGDKPGHAHVSFSLMGEFIQDGKEPLKGILKFKNQDNGKGKEESKS